MSERKSILLRLVPAVHDALARWAADELRSTNAQIEYLLRRALADSGRLPGRAAVHPASQRTSAPVSRYAAPVTTSARDHLVPLELGGSNDANSATYGDYDIYVHSNQPDRTVTATASNGASRSWHTDSSGYADVYLDAAPGDTVKVTVGAATCSTST